MRLRRRICGTVLAAFACGLLSAASAGGKTVAVGQLFIPTQMCTSNPFTLVQAGVSSGSSYTVPKAGVITSWSFEDGATPVSGLKLKVARNAGGGMFTIVGEATAGTQGALSVNTYSANIAVKAGDLIGIYEDGGDCETLTGNGLDAIVGTNSDVPPGTTTGFFVGGGSRFPVSANVALDCVVPKLVGKTLKAAKQALQAASCTLGTVRPKGRTTGTVKSQTPAAGKTLAPRAKVNVRLG